MRQRLIRLNGTYNFRDLGGYPAADGRETAWGRLFRSDDLAHLTDADLALLAEIGMRTHIDFRVANERSYAPDLLAVSVKNVHHLDIDAASLSGLVSARGDGREHGRKAMRSLYRGLVTQYADTYRRFFEIVMDGEAAPLLFHCSAGKDRTGVASALLLSALGVDREVIADDYQLSNQCLAGKYAEFAADESLRPLFEVEPGYLDAAFATLDEVYGGVDNYLRHILKVDVELLRAMYTAPPAE